MSIHTFNRYFKRKSFVISLSLAVLCVIVVGVLWNPQTLTPLRADASGNIENTGMRVIQNFHSSDVDSDNKFYVDSSGNQISIFNQPNTSGFTATHVQSRDANDVLNWEQECELFFFGTLIGNCNIMDSMVTADGHTYVITKPQPNSRFDGVDVDNTIDSPSTSVYRYGIHKVDPSGSVVWTKQYEILNPGITDFGYTDPEYLAFEQSPDEDTISITTAHERYVGVVYDGNTLQTPDINGTGNYKKISSLIDATNGNFIRSSTWENLSSNNEDAQVIPTNDGGALWLFESTAGDSYSINGSVVVNNAASTHYNAVLLDSSNQIVWSTLLTNMPGANDAEAFIMDTSILLRDFNTSNSTVIRKLDLATGVEDAQTLTLANTQSIRTTSDADNRLTFARLNIPAGEIVYGFINENFTVDAFTAPATISDTGGSNTYYADYIDGGTSRLMVYNPGNNDVIDISSTDYTLAADEALLLEFSVPSAGRVLDCRLPSDPNDINSSLINVAPIIEPNYIKTGGDQFGLDILDNPDRSIVTLDAPDRTLYGGGGPTGQSNTNISLYQQPLSFKIIESADAVNSPNTPGATTSITVPGIVGRPMDISTLGIDYDNAGTENQSIYIYALRLADPNTTSLAVDSDITGDVVGMIVEYSRQSNSATIYADNLPAAGYAKDFADFSTDPFAFSAIDDVRASFSPTNDYTTVNIPFATDATLPTNTFYDVATDANGKAYSLIGSTDPSVRTKSGIYEYDGSGNLTTRGAAFPVQGDGGDIEATKSDFTYEGTDDFLDNYIYYTSGFGTANDAAVVRVNPDDTVTKSNDDPVDANFTSANTGYMDKFIFDFDNQIIYYKNGSRSDNDPDQTIGKIYCPTQDQVDNPPLPNPGPDPDPEDPTDPADPGEPGTNGDDPGTGTSTGNSVPEIELVKASNQAGNVDPGDTIIYTITATNNGTVDATNVTIGDVLDPDLIFAGTASCGATYPCTYDANTRTITWAIGTVSPGSPIQVTFQTQAINS